MPKCVLCSKSERIVDKVIAYLSIPANAKFYDQELWANPLDYSNPECNSACCVAGWMVFVGARKTYDRLIQQCFVNETQAYGIENHARDLLLLKNGHECDTNNLFFSTPDHPGFGWPEPFRTMWCEAGSDREKQAKVAVKRLRYFKETGR